MATRRECRRSLRVQTLRRTALECIATLEQRDDRLYVSWATGFPYEAISPLDNLMSLANLRLFMIGWPQRTPVAATMRRKFVIESVPGAVCQHREVFFFGNTNSYARFGKFIREHHGLEVRFVPCHDGGHEFDVVGRFEPSCGETIVAATEKAAAPAQR